MRHLILPPEAYGQRSCDEGPCKAPQREDGDNDCPDQSHLVVLQLHVPALQECLIDKGLNKLGEITSQSAIQVFFSSQNQGKLAKQWLLLTLITSVYLSIQSLLLKCILNKILLPE